MPSHEYMAGLLSGAAIGTLMTLASLGIVIRYFSTKQGKYIDLLAFKGAPEAPCQACKDMITLLEQSNYCLMCGCECHKERVRWYEVQRTKLLGEQHGSRK